MNDYGDIYDNGKPKYQNPEDIYEAVCAMASGEEIGILADMFGDVSWEGQEYYYAEKGQKLQERIENMTDWGNDFLRLRLAAAQMDGIDSNEWIGQALYDDELAKAIGFKKLFIDCILDGQAMYYGEYYNRLFVLKLTLFCPKTNAFLSRTNAFLSLTVSETR